MSMSRTGIYVSFLTSCSMSLKLLSTIVLFFHCKIALEKLKMLFISSKKLFFVPELFKVLFYYPPSPLFLPVGHCFRGWLKLNHQVYNVISYLSKNLITHFVWYLEKEKRYGIGTLSIDRVLNKEHFLQKSSREFARRACPRPLFNFVK